MARNNYPAKIHRLSKDELIERNAKIEKMIELGCSYTDIGSRYGLTAQSVRSLVSHNQVRAGINRMFGSSSNLSRAMYVDGEN